MSAIIEDKLIETVRKYPELYDTQSGTIDNGEKSRLFSKVAEKFKGIKMTG